MKLLFRFLSHPAGVLVVTVVAALFAWSLFNTLRRLDSSQDYAQQLSGSVGQLEQEVAELERQAWEASSAAAQEKIIRNEFDQSPPRILSKVEYRALRDACRGDSRMSAIVELLLQTGMRISELAALQTTDVDLERNVLNIKAQNSRSSRKVPLNTAGKAALTEYLQIRPRAREKAVFLTKTCRPFLVRNIRTAIDRYFRLAGIKDAKVNDLRHTFIIEQLKAGTPMVYISQLVGHKRITTTEKYLKLIQAPEMNPSVQIEEL